MLDDVGAFDLESFLRLEARFHRPGYSAALLLTGKRDIEDLPDVDCFFAWVVHVDGRIVGARSNDAGAGRPRAAGDGAAHIFRRVLGRLTARLARARYEHDASESCRQHFERRRPKFSASHGILPW